MFLFLTKPYANHYPLLISLAGSTAWCQPTDNPYKTRYGGEGHWTDSLPWTSVYNAVTEFNIIPNDGQDDSAAVANALAGISNLGGGSTVFSGRYIPVFRRIKFA